MALLAITLLGASSAVLAQGSSARLLTAATDPATTAPDGATPAPASVAPPTVPVVFTTPPTEPLVQPEYPGGDAALIQFLGQNLRYPVDAWQADVQGRVVVSFWIDEQGKAYGFGVLESLYPSLDEEALRAVRLMPRWEPGRRGGAPAPMVVHVPVTFRRPVGK